MSGRGAGAWLLCLALLGPAHAGGAAAPPGRDNAALVRAAFDEWRAGTGSVFDLLAEDVEWTVAGSRPVSGVYRSKRDFMAGQEAGRVARVGPSGRRRTGRCAR
ncbi:hypothetical protein QFW77_02525 [Luteimonas sp. RD2P54]|uniref:DUF4440 domain-containing protein n=1 Tax=Luteimonas endophytica TaxID=3042023 RepID=A0ABT6J5K7_9GAMM|nr:hypothetical protein [Luteimonas endophytica]MDH5821870.1 hypothetical protein [Luteimonas endophytica]